MKKLFLILLGSCCVLSADEMEPVLAYDFTLPVIGVRGKYKKPVFKKTCRIGMPEHSVLLEEKNFMTVPESSSLTLKQGGTLHAVAYFSGTGESQQDRDYDMVFFKRGEFLLGRDRNLCYFNAGNGRKWMMNVHAGEIHLKKWVVLTVVLIPKGEELYQVKMFLNGKICADRNFKAHFGNPNRENLLIGQGFGGPWPLEGKLAEVMIFDFPLSDSQVRALVSRSAVSRKKDRDAKM